MRKINSLDSNPSYPLFFSLHALNNAKRLCVSLPSRLPVAQPGRWLFFLEGRFPLLGGVCSLHPAVGGTFWIAASDVLVAALDSVFPDRYFSGWTQVEQDCTGCSLKWLFEQI